MAIVSLGTSCFFLWEIRHYYSSGADESSNLQSRTETRSALDRCAAISGEKCIGCPKEMHDEGMLEQIIHKERLVSVNRMHAVVFSMKMHDRRTARMIFFEGFW